METIITTIVIVWVLGAIAGGLTGFTNEPKQ
jgi:uncharacterized membrane protein YuzA (DUF378 family)